MEVFIPVARVGEIPEGALKPAELSGRRVVVANAGGRHFVFVRNCPHAQADLAEGEIRDGQVICNNHGFRFDLESGKCKLPDDGPDLTVLPVVEREGAVCVKISW